MAKQHRRKASLHAPSKVVESELIARAKRLADDPALAAPRCEGSCVLFCPFKKARKAAVKIQAARGDEARLMKYASRGEPLARAYAASLIVAGEKKLPYIGQMRLPFGSLPYVIRGSAQPAQLAGLQNHHDRRAYLVAAGRGVKRRGLHVYSTKDGLVCTGKKPAPPRGFVESELEDLGFEPRGDDRFTCEHGGKDNGDAVLVSWLSAGVTIENCHACVKDANTLHRLLEHVAAPQPRSDFEVGTHFSPLESVSGTAPEDDPEVAGAGALEYIQGAYGDKGLLERSRAARLDALRALPGRAFVAGNSWFGDDADAFTTHLEPTDPERKALDAALAAVDRPVVVDRASAVRALVEVWADHGEAALTAAASGDATTARGLFDPEATPEQVSDAVKRAASRGAKARVEAELPRFKNLRGPAAVADSIARVYRAEGKDAASRLARQKTNEGRDRGVALAFQRALVGGEGESWKFSGVDQEVAAALADDAKLLLECDANAYADILSRLSAAAGGSGDLQRA